MLQLTSVKKDIGKNARSCSGIDNNFRMPFFDNWLLGFLKNERNITMIARSEGTGELMGLVIMEVLPSQSKETATKMKTPRYLECPEKFGAIYKFHQWALADMDVARDYGVREWADVFIVSTNTHNRVPGLGSELVARGVEEVVKKGIKVKKSGKMNK